MIIGRKILSNLIHEPLVQFSIPALFIFLLYSLVNPVNDQEIKISNEIKTGLIENQEQILGRKLNTPEKEELISDYIDEEILYREAIKRGLDIGDGKIRHRLINKMLFLYQGTVTEPREQDLQDFYAINKHYYTIPSTITFENVFFESDINNSGQILDKLNSGVISPKIGDEFWLGPVLEKYNEKELSSILGKEFAKYVFNLEPGLWTGPVRSSRGVHFVRLLSIQDPQPIPLDQIRNVVKEDWFKSQAAINIDDKINKLREDYITVVNPD